MPTRVTLVIPCFNEERRLDRGELLSLAAGERAPHLLLVDDGSTDGTRGALRALEAEAPGQISVLTLDRNRGKAEAVRAGLRAALASGARVVGYADADFSTPACELRRLLASMAERPADVLLGARVRLLGARIDRRVVRHYLGRVFATVASLALRLPVYDTQCGAKLFARSPALEAALERPFRSRWVFDIELLGRLLAGAGGAPPVSPDRFREIPLTVWRDAGGSKLRPGGMVVAGLQLLGFFVRSWFARPRARARSETGEAGATGSESTAP